MQERKINLEDIWNKYKEFTKGPNLPGMVDLDYFKPIVNLMICEGISQALELASENATINGGNCYGVTDEGLYAQFPLIVNKQSILDTINQVI